MTPASLIVASYELCALPVRELAEVAGVSVSTLTDWVARGRAELAGETYKSRQRKAPPTPEHASAVYRAVARDLERRIKALARLHPR